MTSQIEEGSYYKAGSCWSGSTNFWIFYVKERTPNYTVGEAILIDAYSGTSIGWRSLYNCNRSNSATKITKDQYEVLKALYYDPKD